MKVVFDTNTIVSALLFDKGSLSWLREHWQQNNVTPLASKATVSEIIRVLCYPKFQLSQYEMQIVLTEYLPFVETVLVRPQKNTPRCPDADDQIFVDLALTADAGVLVTGDKALLGMKLLCPVLTPAAYRKSWGPA